MNLIAFKEMVVFLFSVAGVFFVGYLLGLFIQKMLHTDMK